VHFQKAAAEADEDPGAAAAAAVDCVVVLQEHSGKFDMIMLKEWTQESEMATKYSYFAGSSGRLLLLCCCRQRHGLPCQAAVLLNVSSRVPKRVGLARRLQ
jgi:hypothetical protein